MLTITCVLCPGGNRLQQQQFRLHWAWVSLEQPRYTVQEEHKFLEVVLRRRGYLGETSFVSIGTRDGTALKDQDFRGKAQRQVQFNPGQSSAVWRVRILPDSEYEVSESFHIVLSEAVMAVLEYPQEAAVEILDPEDVRSTPRCRLHAALQAPRRAAGSTPRCRLHAALQAPRRAAGSTPRCRLHATISSTD
uniref:Calx-beta domain-containing protein n=1 Tax=Knipowitschia caucasica TaxID=637954 RepID=A0AAV2J6M4_KNICA